MLDTLSNDLVLAVGLTLVNFLWQGAVVGLVIATILSACPRATAHTRYTIACAGLIVMAAAPAVTLAVVIHVASPTAPPNASAPMMLLTTPVLATATTSGLPTWLPAVVTVWLAGALFLSIRLARGWWTTERVRRRDTRMAPEYVTDSVRRMAARLGISRDVSALESPWVEGPTVIGWIRPSILMPIGALTGLSIQQLEAVLSHELAHIRRHDYLVNGLQNVVETLFFYHPSVWWLSRQIRVEREHCCDDIAVEACGNAVVYARALATLEETRMHQVPLALAATDGSLLTRVRRLIGPSGADGRQPALPIAACVVVIMLGVSLTSRAAAPGLMDPAPPVAVFQTAPMAATVVSTGEAAVRSDIQGLRNAIDRFHADEARYPESLDELTSERHLNATTLQGVGQPPAASVVHAASQTARTDRMLEPRKIVDVAPIYPPAARESGIEGTVVLEITIDADGRVDDIRILRSITALDQAAINAVRQWRYAPTIVDNAPTAVTVTVPVPFSLTPNSSVPADSAAAAEPDAAELYRRLLTIRSEQAARLAARGDARRSSAARAVAPPAPDDQTTLRVGGDIREPRKIRDQQPVYPAAAQAAGVSGTVIMEATIDPAGHVTNVRVLRSIPMLDEAAVEAVRQWRYTPTLFNGVPVSVMMTVTINFSLN